MTQKKKICLVVQRYGVEVNGGAELQARQMAERLSDQYDVTVYTTKAIDYISWANEYACDREDLNGVHVCRFPVEHPRRPEIFDSINQRFLSGNLYGKKWEDAWFEAQGPYTPALIEALRIHRDDFSAFLVFTYLYYPSVYGLPILKEKAIFIPEAHDEPFLRLERVRQEFQCPHAFFFNTKEEEKLVRERFWNEQISSDIGGVGVDSPKDVDTERFRHKYELGDTSYLLYVGRIDEGKNCHEMFRYWDSYKRRNPSNLKLILMGKAVIPVPEREDIRVLGFVSDEDKFDGMAGAQFLWLPSKFESLSMVVLESLLMGTPVLVNSSCEVLRAHCLKSNAGLYYENYMQFEQAVNRLLTDQTLYTALAKNGPDYVKKNYNWNDIIRKLSALIESIQ